MKERTILLASGACDIRGCIFCGYSKVEPKSINLDKIKKDFERQTRDEGIELLKIFVSGSFLDDKQFPREYRQWVAAKVKEKKIKHLVIESIPKFITKENLSDFEGIKLSVAIGLEVADNALLKRLGKNITVEEYDEKALLLKELGIGLRTYLVVNAPFVDDIHESAKKSVEKALEHSESVVLINMLPHAKTILFNRWVKGRWSPLSKKEFMKVTDDLITDSRVERDAETFKFIPKISPEDYHELKGANSKVLNDRHFELWQEYFQKFYEKPKNKTIALFLQCSAKKPYRRSNTHKRVQAVLQKSPLNESIHKLVLSTPGVCPIEYDSYYPFNSYDWPEWEETSEIRKEYTQVISKRIKEYLQVHSYEKYLCYLKPSSDTYKALKQACDELNIKLINLLDKDVYEKIKDKPNPVAQPEAVTCFEKNLIKLMEGF